MIVDPLCACQGCGTSDSNRYRNASRCLLRKVSLMSIFNDSKVAVVWARLCAVEMWLELSCSLALAYIV